jgi:hypothetical protein
MIAMSTSKASTKAIVAQRGFHAVSIEAVRADPAAWQLVLMPPEGARLLLTDPERYPVERIVGFARWLMDQMAA